MTLGELKKVLSFTAPLSICDRKTLTYFNYPNVRFVPDEMDNIEVSGVGLTKDFAEDIDEEIKYMPLVEIIVEADTLWWLSRHKRESKK